MNLDNELFKPLTPDEMKKVNEFAKKHLWYRQMIQFQKDILELTILIANKAGIAVQGSDGVAVPQMKIILPPQPGKN
jgi:hypothetical protein